MRALRVIRSAGDALSERQAAERDGLEALASHGRLLVETFGAAHVFDEPVAAAAVRVYLAREAVKLVSVASCARSYLVRPLADGLVIVTRDGVELARGENTAIGIAGILLRRELGAEHQRFSAMQFARDFEAVINGSRSITSDEIRAWAEGQG